MARHRSAKPSTAVRIRQEPQKKPQACLFITVSGFLYFKGAQIGAANDTFISGRLIECNNIFLDFTPSFFFDLSELI